MSFDQTVSERFADWNYGHPLILAGFIRAMKPDVVVEVGSYRGFGACHMAHALQQNNKGKLYCIDNWSLQEHVERCGDPRTHFEGNLNACGVREWVEILDGDSDKVKWPDNIDMCYIDAWHSYNSAMQDFLQASVLGAKFIALDDTENCVGPRLFVDEFRESLDAEKWDIADIHSDNGMAIFVKRQPKRLITFSQELPPPCVGVDLRPLTLEQQAEHFFQSTKITGLDYSSLFPHTEHDIIL